jgi:hypothetical protein
MSMFQTYDTVKIKQASRETNELLKELLVAQHRTNQLLEWLGTDVLGNRTS